MINKRPAAKLTAVVASHVVLKRPASKLEIGAKKAKTEGRTVSVEKSRKQVRCRYSGTSFSIRFDKHGGRAEAIRLSNAWRRGEHEFE